MRLLARNNRNADSGHMLPICNNCERRFPISWRGIMDIARRQFDYCCRPASGRGLRQLGAAPLPPGFFFGLLP